LESSSGGLTKVKKKKGGVIIRGGDLGKQRVIKKDNKAWWGKDEPPGAGEKNQTALVNQKEKTPGARRREKDKRMETAKGGKNRKSGKRSRIGRQKIHSKKGKKTARRGHEQWVRDGEKNEFPQVKHNLQAKDPFCLIKPRKECPFRGRRKKQRKEDERKGGELRRVCRDKGGGALTTKSKERVKL